MGMFDNITCELPLPLNKKEQKTFSNINWKDVVFQTKDTECTLSTYSIRKNGKLYGLFIEGKNVRVISEKEEKKIRKKGKFCWPYEFKEKSRKYKFEKFTGDLYFYDSIFDEEGNEYWAEFSGKFLSGVLQGKLKKVEIRLSQTAKEIKKNDENFKNLIAKEQAKLSSKIKRTLNKYTCGYWRMFWITLGGYIRKFVNKIQYLDIWINRNIA
jgi:hypothetical protein